MDTHCDLFLRFVRAALRGDFRLHNAKQLLSLEPEAPELTHALQDFYKVIAIFVSRVTKNRGPSPELDLEIT